MTNKTRYSILSARGGILGGRVNARLRIYTLGEGADSLMFFSLRLWQAAGLRQVRLARACQE
jgi:hypothetical protein